MIIIMNVLKEDTVIHIVCNVYNVVYRVIYMLPEISSAWYANVGKRNAKSDTQVSQRSNTFGKKWR